MERWGLSKTFQTHTMAVSALAMHPKNSVVATGSDDGSWKMWSLPAGELINFRKSDLDADLPVVDKPKQLKEAVVPRGRSARLEHHGFPAADASGDVACASFRAALREAAGAAVGAAPSAYGEGADAALSSRQASRKPPPARRSLLPRRRRRWRPRRRRRRPSVAAPRATPSH